MFIDNAEKNGAAVARDGSTGAILLESCYQTRSCALLIDWYRTQVLEPIEALDWYDPETTHVAVWCEDVFKAAAFKSNSYEPALVNQGRLESCTHLWFNKFSWELIKPSIWQTSLGYVHKNKGGAFPSTKSWAKAKCTELGYTPPAWTRLQPDSAKALEDIRDAYLGSEYSLRIEITRRAGVPH